MRGEGLSYEKFKGKCLELIEDSGEEIDVEFSNNDGKFIARFSNGVKIVGNPVCMSIRVFWGSGHSAVARI